MKTTPITAALLVMAACAPVAAELNVKQLLILRKSAKNNANTSASVLGESLTAKGARTTLPSSRQTPLAPPCICVSGSADAGPAERAQAPARVAARQEHHPGRPARQRQGHAMRAHRGGVWLRALVCRYAVRGGCVTASASSKWWWCVRTCAAQHVMHCMLARQTDSAE